jgi:GDP-4-dehydro-6-deoxy-D-mannose reductase
VTGHPYKTLLITGAAGFIGRHLTAHLLSQSDGPRRVVAVDTRHGTGGAQWLSCDLSDPARVADVIHQVQPDGVVHLAGLTTGDDPDAYFSANVLACRNVLAACRNQYLQPRVLVMGSAAQYGITAGGHEVVDESRPLLATTPYGVSKCIQERWALAYAAAGGPPVVCVRPFNIMGPGQSTELVPAAFLRQVALVLAGRELDVAVGNTSTKRDFLDVRDLVAAIWALMKAPDDAAQNRVFNIASGEAVGIDQMLSECLSLAGRPIVVRRDPSRVKAVDVPVIVGDVTRLRAATDWRPTINWRCSLADVWREIAPRAAFRGQRT